MKNKEVHGILKKRRIDSLLLLSLDSMRYNHNIFYFTGFKGVGSYTFLKNSSSFLLVPKMEFERAKKSYKKVYSIDKKKLFVSLKLKLKKHRIRSLGIDYRSTNISLFRLLKKEFKKIKIKDVSKELVNLRQIKTNVEIKKLKKSCQIADKILQKCLNKFNKFKTESDVSSFLEYETKKLACDVSFPPIVASGKNASIPHHEPKNIKLKKGFCVIDFGVKCKGYCSDITRTIYLGTPNNKEKEIYNFLLNIQNNIIKKIKIKDNCGKIYDDCVKSLKNYSKYFTHGLGHGVGVEIHELPNLTLSSKDKVEKNMVFTIEPGIYIPNKYGIRIEDTLLMKNLAKPLTKTTKELLNFR